MPDTMPTDTVRAELMRSATEALYRAAPALPEDARTLLHHLHAAIPTGELASARPEDMAAAAASLWSLAERRPAGQALVRVSPGAGVRAVAEIVTDDMPFLVDSALAAIAPGGTVHQVLHPVLPMRRDGDGRLLAAGEGEMGESLMRIEFSAARGAGDLAGIDRALRRAMTDVRVVT